MNASETKPNLITTLNHGSMLVLWNEEYAKDEVVTVEDYVECAAIVSAASGDLLGVVRIDRETEKPTELLGALTGFRETVEAALVA